MPHNPHADFDPVLKPYSGQGAFRFWCQLALPLTFDDSLSYYELLNKVVVYLNNTIQDVANVEENVEALNTAYNELQNYVNEYFDSLDLQTEIDRKLDEMASDGTLTDLLSPFIPDAVTAWLNQHITYPEPGEAVIVDNTLSVAGAAADSKITGDNITNIKEQTGIFGPAVWREGRLSQNGQVVTADTATNSLYTLPIAVDNTQSLFVYAPVIPEGANNLSVYIARYTSKLESSFISWTILNTFDRNYAIIPIGDTTNYIRICIRAKLGNTFDAVDLPLSWHKNVYVIYATGSIANIANIQDYKIRATVADMVADTTLLNGEYVQTLGFDAVGDNGEALYKIQAPTTQNLISVFTLDNGLSAVRVFSDSVTLQSLGFPRINISNINNVIEANGIKKVKCGNLETPYVITLGDYDFEFDTITYTGNNYAIVASNYRYHHIIGNKLLAPNGNGFYADCDQGSVTGNIININRIDVKIDGITLCPTNHLGIAYNKYFIGTIRARRYGLYVYFRKGQGEYQGRIQNYYAWESEEVFSIGNINASPDDNEPITGDEKAIYYRIPDDNGHADYGTISGITFLDLGVESSVVGIVMQCGIAKNAATSGARSVAGIKSVVIQSMRVREFDKIQTFMDVYGFIWDIYIKPTSPIRLDQWEIDVSPTKSGVFIDAPIFSSSSVAPVGHGLKAVRRICYIDKPIDAYMNVTGDIDYSILKDDPANASAVFLSKYYVISNTKSGETVSLSLEYSYGESARDILIRVPKYKEPVIVPGEETNEDPIPTTVNITFQTGTETVIVNNTNEDHLYSLSCFTNRNDYSEIHVLRDLGSIE